MVKERNIRLLMTGTILLIIWFFGISSAGAENEYPTKNESQTVVVDEQVKIE